MFPTLLITSFIVFDCSRLDFHVPGHSADERSGLPTSRSRTTFENTSPIHVTLKMRKQTNVWAQANTRTRRKRIPRRDGLNEREDKYIITIITVRESTFSIKMWSGSVQQNYLRIARLASLPVSTSNCPPPPLARVLPEISVLSEHPLLFFFIISIVTIIWSIRRSYHRLRFPSL